MELDGIDGRVPSTIRRKDGSHDRENDKRESHGIEPFHLQNRIGIADFHQQLLLRECFGLRDASFRRRCSWELLYIWAGTTR